MADKAELEVGSKEKAALDLMRHIASYEESYTPDAWLKPDARTYFLQLYRQCVRATSPGLDLDTSSHKGAK